MQAKYGLDCQAMEIYSVYGGNLESGKGVSFSTSNKRTLSEKTGISYWMLVRLFTREGRKYYVHDDGTVIIRSSLFYRGRGRNMDGGFKN